MKILKWSFKIFMGLVLLSFLILVLGSHFPTYFSPYEKLKKKQNEAKYALFALYQGEMAFQLEQHTFSTSLSGIGVGCLEKVSYSYGFLLPSSTEQATSLKRTGNDEVNAINCDPTKGADLAMVKSYCSDCTAGKNKFKAVAWARLPNNKLDIWTIDENKKLVNVLNGAENAK